MEQEPEKRPIGAADYRVLWHSEIKKDLSKLTPGIVAKIVSAADHRLSRAPQYIGQPLKGTTHLLWKIRFDKYRLVYTLNPQAREVWVLSVQKRDIVYKQAHLQSLLRLALSIHQSERKA